MANVEKVSLAVAQRRVQAIEELGRQWDAGLASGQAVDGVQAFERIRARLDAKLTAQNQQ
jgi:antitoxin ParD1/3/4